MLATRCACALGIRAALPSLSVRKKSAYEGEGKTVVHVLNNDLDLGIMIDSYSNVGFRLNNGVTILGPMAIFPRTVLSWQVKTSQDINEDSLRLFKLLDPKIDLLLIGLEAPGRALAQPVLLAARRLGLNVEVLDTEKACSTFNFLSVEGRSVAAAMLPPLHVDMNENDMMQSKLHYEDIYKQEML